MNNQPKKITYKKALDVKKRYRSQLFRNPEVMSIGIGLKPTYANLCIVIGVKTKAGRATVTVTELDGIPVIVEVTGEFKTR
jgi:hypothetical protein